MANPFSHWKPGDVDSHNARVAMRTRQHNSEIVGEANSTIEYRKANNETACRRESELHEQILDECRRRQWLPFHGSMANRTFRTEGEPDFVILRDNGQFLLVECKSGGGKLSMAQLAIHAWARKLDHVVHVVRCFEDFLKLVQ